MPQFVLLLVSAGSMSMATFMLTPTLPLFVKPCFRSGSHSSVREQCWSARLCSRGRHARKDTLSKKRLSAPLPTRDGTRRAVNQNDTSSQVEVGFPARSQVRQVGREATAVPMGRHCLTRPQRGSYTSVSDRVCAARGAKTPSGRDSTLPCSTESTRIATASARS